MSKFTILTGLIVLGFVVWIGIWNFRWTTGCVKIDTHTGCIKIDAHNILDETDYITKSGDLCGWVYSTNSNDTQYEADIFDQYSIPTKYFSTKQQAEDFVTKVCKP